MGQKEKVFWGILLLAAGTVGYYWAESEMNTNSYRFAHAIGMKNDGPEVVLCFSIFGAILGVLFLLRAVYHWLLWRNSDDDEE